MDKKQEKVVVTPEEFRRMTSDQIARLLREHKDYWIIREEDTYIIKK